MAPRAENKAHFAYVLDCIERFSVLACLVLDRDTGLKFAEELGSEIESCGRAGEETMEYEEGGFDGDVVIGKVEVMADTRRRFGVPDSGSVEGILGQDFLTIS